MENDCGGGVIKGNTGGGLAGSTGKFGVCAAGTTSCKRGAIACLESVQRTAEVCAGLDNDCDGVVDQGNPGGGLACSTGKFGVCAAGTTSCQAGAIVCLQNVDRKREV